MEKEVHVDTYVDVELELSTSEISEAIEEDSTSFEDIQGYEAWPFHEVWDWVTEQDEYERSNPSKIKELEATIEKQNIKLNLLDGIFKSVQALAEQMSHTANVLETEVASVEEAGPPDTFTACSDNGADHA